MKATLEGQPRELARLLGDRASASRAAERLRGSARIYLAGTGTSHHGALAGQFMLRSAGLDAWAVRAFELAAYPPRIDPADALILLSHRGSKRFSRLALDHFAGSSDRWLAITGEGSVLDGEGVVHTVEQEGSPVHTASHTGALVRLAQIAVALGTPDWSQELERIPDLVAAAVRLRPEVAATAAAIESGAVVHFAGGGPATATAMEGALKLREAAHLVTAEAHDIEGILHGPLVSIQPDHVAVLVAQPGAAFDRTREVADALHEIGVHVMAVGAAAFQIKAADRVLTPEVSEVLAPIVNVVPLQWLAYEVAGRLGVDADSFRRDEPAYGAAQSKFTL